MTEEPVLFLVEYDRQRGALVTFRTFPDSARQTAEDARLGLELDLQRQGIEREVVLLQARSEAILRRSHRRYFENLAEIARTPAE